VTFSVTYKILFQHCDPAGIVYFPRYFDLINATIESWFDERVGVTFEDLHGPRGGGVPTLNIKTTFHAPSRHGDRVAFQLTPRRIGTSSLNLNVLAECEGEKRLTTELTLVYIHHGGRKSEPWPDDIRRAILNELNH